MIESRDVETLYSIPLALQAQGMDQIVCDHLKIDAPVADDIIAAGDAISINAPVDSAIAAGGTVSINAPVKGDVLALGGQVYVNSDVGGKVVAAGGTVHLGGRCRNQSGGGRTEDQAAPGKECGQGCLYRRPGCLQRC